MTDTYGPYFLKPNKAWKQQFLVVLKKMVGNMCLWVKQYHNIQLVLHTSYLFNNKFNHIGFFNLWTLKLPSEIRQNWTIHEPSPHLYKHILFLFICLELQIFFWKGYFLQNISVSILCETLHYTYALSCMFSWEDPSSSQYTGILQSVHNSPMKEN